MNKVLLLWLSLVLALISWGAAGAEDGVYAIPAMKGNYAPVPKTGQTYSYSPGDDGDLEKGVAWPSPRFHDNGNGTVTDRLTGLIWTKNANCFDFRIWSQSLGDAATLADGVGGLTDGSKAGDWRIPNIRELQSLTSYLPAGHPFINVGGRYWSSTRYAPYTLEGVWAYSYDTGTRIAVGHLNTSKGWFVRDAK